MVKNPLYMVTIIQQQPQGRIEVVAPMPQEFMFDTQSNYEAPFAQGFFGNSSISSFLRLGGVRLSSQALTAQIWQGSNDTQLGIDLEFQAETDPIAEVRDPIINLKKMTTPSISSDFGTMLAPGPQLDLTLVNAIQAGVASFQAGKDIIATTLGQDVETGKMNNTATTVPGGKDATTNAATTNRIGQKGWWKDKVHNAISLQIGNYAFFDSVVITAVQETWGSDIDRITGLPLYARVQVQFKPLFQILQSDLDDIFKVAKAPEAVSGFPTPVKPNGG